jgi:hypothetical protein
MLVRPKNMTRLFTLLATIALMLGQLSIASEAAQRSHAAPSHVQGVEAIHGCCDMDVSTVAMDDCAKYCAQAVLGEGSANAPKQARELLAQDILPLKSILDWPTGPPPIGHHTSFEL